MRHPVVVFCSGGVALLVVDGHVRVVLTSRQMRRTLFRGASVLGSAWGFTQHNLQDTRSGRPDIDAEHRHRGPFMRQSPFFTVLSPSSLFGDEMNLSMDVVETKDALMINMDMPGFSSKS